MNSVSDYRAIGCRECANGEALGFDFTMAFQPIIDVAGRKVYAYEALVRGHNNEPAGEIFKHVNSGNLYRFDQTCRVKAVKLASELGMDCLLSINFMPNAVYKPELCIRTTLAAADQYQFPVEKILFEMSESEEIDDPGHMKRIVSHYQKCGFLTAIDDFGAGYAGLGFLADVQTDVVKLDMALIRDIDFDQKRQSIVAGILKILTDLGIQPIVEGVETLHEYEKLADMGVNLFQGYYFARPQLEQLSGFPAHL